MSTLINDLTAGFESEFLGDAPAAPTPETPVEAAYDAAIEAVAAIESPAKAKGRKPRKPRKDPAAQVAYYAAEAAAPAPSAQEVPSVETSVNTAAADGTIPASAAEQGALYRLPSGKIRRFLCGTESGYSFLPIGGGSPEILDADERVEPVASELVALNSPDAATLEPGTIQYLPAEERAAGLFGQSPQQSGSLPLSVLAKALGLEAKPLTAALLAQSLRAMIHVLENG